jgi:hypothetical protein
VIYLVKAKLEGDHLHGRWSPFSKQEPDTRLIINDKNFYHGFVPSSNTSLAAGAASSRGKSIKKVVPAPSAELNQIVPP